MNKIKTISTALAILCSYSLLNISCQGEGGRSAIKITDETVSISGYENSEIKVSGLSSVTLSGDASTILSASAISLNDDDSWLFLPNVSRAEWDDSKLSKRIFINGEALKVGGNADLINYYNGLYIKPYAMDDYSPATLYSNTSKQGYDIKESVIYIGDAIPAGDNLLKSFTLKRGHMMVVAENNDGTGESKTFIAVSENLVVDLEEELRNRVSFIRVVPWSYVSKRGIGGGFDRREELSIGWYYNWGTKHESTSSIDFVPMVWGRQSLPSTPNIITKSKTNHILAFNEPDGKDQANLSPEEAVELYPTLLQCGLRVGSPACTEGKWNSWLSEFMDGCKRRGYRVDFIATHWYDWGNWIETKDAEPDDVAAIVARFKSDIDRCYKKYGLPIWITEFNANKNRLTHIQIEFLKQAIPMLEAHPHVERYAFFQPFGGMGDFITDDKLTETAKAYNSAETTPAVR